MPRQVVNDPLFIEDRSVHNNEVRRGSSIKRHVIVKNLGDKVAEIDFWIVPTDHKSEPLLRWCRFSKKNPLRLNPKKSVEVTLNFEVPPQATPDLCNYEILVEAPAQYPGKLVRRPQQLRVLPSEQDTEWGTDPGFTLQPVTTAASPYLLQAGEQLEVKVQVENRSKRVDRFYLTCPELTCNWYTVRYPESSIELSGLVKETDGLELNPNSTGEIVLLLHPPQLTLAGNYFPTIRLVSSVKEDLVLLDVVYLQILPNESLKVQLHPLLRQVPDEAGEFRVELINRGNIRREISILAGDREKLFDYTLKPPQVLILPGENKRISLRAKPRKWWRRPFRGKGLEFQFDIKLENALAEVSPAISRFPEPAQLPTLPQELPQGTLVWQPRPWWLLWLLALLALGTLGLIALIIWWKVFNLPIPPSPEVIRFSNAVDNSTKTGKVYQEGYGDAIRLDWEISGLSKIYQVTVIRLEGNVEKERKSYIFNGTIPEHLQKRENQTNNFCWEKSDGIVHNSSPKRHESISFTPLKIDNFSLKKDIEKAKKTSVLNCQGIITSAKEAGNYNFKIEVFTEPNQNEPIAYQMADTITINPTTPQPKIIELFSTKPFYEELSTELAQLPKLKSESSRLMKVPIRLNWEITNPSQLKEIRLMSLAPDGSINSELKRYEIKNNTLPPELREFCQPKGKLDLKKNLVCRNVPTDARQEGGYNFTLTVVHKPNPQSLESQKTATIKILPVPSPPPPEISDFSPTQSVYEEVGLGLQQVSGTSPQTPASNSPSSRPIPGPIRLNWEIANPSQIQELKLVGLSSDGSIASELKRYPIINNTLPPELKEFCSLSATNLICRGVSTDASDPGDYTFNLTVVSQQGQEQTEITQKTATIKVKPLPLKIVSFKINNQEVSQMPKYTFPINKERSSVDIVVSWQVEGGRNIKVELLPAPGIVPSKGSVKYSLSKPPNREIITLKVTNAAGEEKVQSVVIETVEVNRPNQSQTSPSTGASSGAASPGTASPSPTNPNTLSPIELPPSPE